MNTTMENLATDIYVAVETDYIEAQSDPDDERYVFSYTITVKNQSDIAVQLMHRHWLITDANGEATEVHGEGVIGKQPHIKAGKDFSYTSGCILKTPLGTMQGSYEVIDESGELLKVEIPVFRLAIPNILN